MKNAKTDTIYIFFFFLLTQNFNFAKRVFIKNIFILNKDSFIYIYIFFYK